MKQALFTIVGCAIAAYGVASWPGSSAAAAVIVQDNFNRADSNTVGTMSDGIHSWYELAGTDDPGLEQISGNTLFLTYDSSHTHTGVTVNGVTAADGVIKVTLPSRYNDTSGTRRISINYRAGSLANGADPYSAKMYHLIIYQGWGGTTDMTLNYGASVIAGSATDLGSDQGSHTFEVSFVGNEHIVKMDGVEKYSYTETNAGRDGAGYVGLGDYYGYKQQFDDFSLSSVPEPGTLSAALVLMGGLVLRRRR
jgi:hypothetical protein